jgi:hypothetical protein
MSGIEIALTVGASSVVALASKYIYNSIWNNIGSPEIDECYLYIVAYDEIHTTLNIYDGNFYHEFEWNMTDGNDHHQNNDKFAGF